MSSRKASGRARELLLLRLGLMAALIVPPSYIVATDQNDMVKLLFTGAICLAAALIRGQFLTIQARFPVMPNIRGHWLNELLHGVGTASLTCMCAASGTTLHRTKNSPPCGVQDGLSVAQGF